MVLLLNQDRLDRDHDGIGTIGGFERKIMEQNLVYLIAGGGIGLIGSIVTLIITHSFQSRDDYLKRKWELEDFERSARTKIDLDRIDLIEKLTLEIYSSMSDIYDILIHIEDQDSQEKELFFRTLSVAKNSFILKATSTIISDPLLVTQIDEFSDQIETYSKLIIEFINLEDLEKKMSFFSQFGKNHGKWTNVVTLIIKILNDNRHKIVSST